MAKAEKTSTGRAIGSLDSVPSHVSARSGAGKPRTPTEFDDLIPQWYEEGVVKRIPAQGDTEEELLADLDTIYKEVAKAAALHNLGVRRKKENNPNDPNFTGYNVYVEVGEKQASRGREKGSLKDPVTGNFISPSDESQADRYAELLADKQAKQSR